VIVLSDGTLPSRGSTRQGIRKGLSAWPYDSQGFWHLYSARIINDDRDAYPNKRVDLPGFLMANLFRTFFAK
jgi:hypothetical protein